KNQERDNSFFAMSVSGLLMSFLIRNFCSHFPELKTVFEKQLIINQILINFLNKTFRGKDYVINNSINLLD
ncbi:MAG: hypothetical protein ACXWEY_10740, partial [Bacteroidia bacterium]